MTMKRQKATEISRANIETHDELVNPRTVLTNVEELAVDIRENGLTYGPLVWRSVGKSKKVKYFLLDGWRRMAAIKLIREGFKYDGETYDAMPDAFESVAVVQWEGELQEAQFRIVGANIQRDPLSNLEMADSLLKLAKNKVTNPNGFTNRAIARRLGKSETWVSRVLSFAKQAEPVVKEAVRKKEITEQAAHLISTEADPEEQERQVEVAKEAKKKGKPAPQEIARKKGKPSVPGKKVLMEVAKLIPESSPTELEERGANGFEAGIRFAAGEMSLEEAFTYAGFTLPEGVDIDKILGGYTGPIRDDKAAEKKAAKAVEKAEAAEKKKAEKEAKKAAKIAEKEAAKEAKAAEKKKVAEAKKAEKEAAKKEAAEAKAAEKGAAKEAKATEKKVAADAKTAEVKAAAEAKKVEKAAAKEAKAAEKKATKKTKREVVVTNDDNPDPPQETAPEPEEATEEAPANPDLGEIPF